MKTAISIADPIFESAEKLAKRLGISRSQLYSNAVAAWVEKYLYSGITEQLDAIYGADPGTSLHDQDLEEMQSQSLARDKW